MAKLTLSSEITDFTIDLHPPIKLDQDKKYECAFLSLHTYNSLPNITETNNIFRYSPDNGTSWKNIVLSRGAYELRDITSAIQRRMVQNRDYNEAKNKSYINIDHHKPTFKSILDIKNSNYIVDFTNENSIASTLGFNKERLPAGYHLSPNIINIEKVNSILIHCDIVLGTYVNSKTSNVLYNFAMTVSPGYKVIERPTPELIFLPIVERPEIQSIRIWLTDQDNNPLDLMGEKLTINILIRERK